MDDIINKITGLLFDYPQLAPFYTLGLYFLIVRPILNNSGGPKLPSPKVTTRKMYRYAIDGKKIEFIKEYRRSNPGLSIEEAKSDYKFLRSQKYKS